MYFLWNYKILELKNLYWVNFLNTKIWKKKFFLFNFKYLCAFEHILLSLLFINIKL